MTHTISKDAAAARERASEARGALKDKAYYIERLTASGVPTRMHDGVVGYLLHGWSPGDFLFAVLTNDLSGACGRADAENSAALCAYVRFFFNNVPSIAWGTEARVMAWIAAASED